MINVEICLKEDQTANLNPVEDIPLFLIHR